MSSSILTIDEAKILMKISLDDTSNDDFIELNIPIVEDYIKTHCKDDFADGYPSGLKLVASQMINYNLQRPLGNVDNEKIGASYSVTYNNTYPQYIITQLNTYNKIRFI